MHPLAGHAIFSELGEVGRFKYRFELPKYIRRSFGFKYGTDSDSRLGIGVRIPFISQPTDSIAVGA